MSQIIGKCGYRCDLCPAYEPNIKSDADKQRMLDAWAKYFGFQIPPEKFTACAGCAEKGGYPDCTVRPCAIEKGIENCAHCDQFACDKVSGLMNFVDEKVKDLSSVPEEDYRLFIEPFMSKERLTKIRDSAQA
jgi:hypothetical protein